MGKMGEVKEMAKIFCLFMLYVFFKNRQTATKTRSQSHMHMSIFNFKDYCNVMSNNLCHRPLAVPYPLLRCISIALIFCRHKSVQHGLPAF